MVPHDFGFDDATRHGCQKEDGVQGGSIFTTCLDYWYILGVIDTSNDQYEVSSHPTLDAR